MMIVGKIEKVGAGADGTAFGVGSAEIDVPDMGLDDGAGTHVAGLKRDIEIAVEYVPGGKLFAGFGDRDHFGMKRGILLCLGRLWPRAMILPSLTITQPMGDSPSS